MVSMVIKMRNKKSERTARRLFFLLFAFVLFLPSPVVLSIETTEFPMHIIAKGNNSAYDAFVSYSSGYIDKDYDGDGVGEVRIKAYADHDENPWRILLVDARKGLIQIRRDENNTCITFMRVGASPDDFVLKPCDPLLKTQQFLLIPSEKTDGHKKYIDRIYSRSLTTRKLTNALDLSQEREYQIYYPEEDKCLHRRDQGANYTIGDIVAWDCKTNEHSASYQDKFIFAQSYSPGSEGFRVVMEDRSLAFTGDLFYLGKDTHFPAGYLSYDSAKLALWSNEAVMFQFYEKVSGVKDQKNMVKSYSVSVDEGLEISDEPALSGYTSGFFKESEIKGGTKDEVKLLKESDLSNFGGFEYNATSTNSRVRLISEGSVSRSVGYEYSLGTNTTVGIERSTSAGPGPLPGITVSLTLKFEQSFSTGQKWLTNAATSHRNAIWREYVVAPYETIWTPVVQRGTKVTSQWDLSLINGTQYKTLPVTIVIKTSELGGASGRMVCSSGGITKNLVDKNTGELILDAEGRKIAVKTGAYPPGHPCLQTWPKGVMQEFWGDEALHGRHVQYPPKDHVYRGPETGDIPYDVDLYKDQLNHELNYKISLNGGNDCLFYSPDGSGSIEILKESVCATKALSNQWSVTDATHSTYRKLCVEDFHLCLGVEKKDNKPEIKLLTMKDCMNMRKSRGSCLWVYDSSGSLRNMGTDFPDYCLDTSSSGDKAILASCEGTLNQKVTLVFDGSNVFDGYANQIGLFNIRFNYKGKGSKCLVTGKANKSRIVESASVAGCSGHMAHKWRVSKEKGEGGWRTICNYLSMCIRFDGNEKPLNLSGQLSRSHHACKTSDQLIDDRCLWKFDHQKNQFINKASTTQCLSAGALDKPYASRLASVPAYASRCRERNEEQYYRQQWDVTEKTSGNFKSYWVETGKVMPQTPKNPKKMPGVNGAQLKPSFSISKLANHGAKDVSYALYIKPNQSGLVLSHMDLGSSSLHLSRDFVVWKDSNGNGEYDSEDQKVASSVGQGRHSGVGITFPENYLLPEAGEVFFIVN